MPGIPWTTPLPERRQQMLLTLRRISYLASGRSRTVAAVLQTRVPKRYEAYDAGSSRTETFGCAFVSCWEEDPEAATGPASEVASHKSETLTFRLRPKLRVNKERRK